VRGASDGEGSQPQADQLTPRHSHVHCAAQVYSPLIEMDDGEEPTLPIR